MLGEMRAAGVNVQTPRCDITDSSALQAAVSNCLQTMPKIRGCIQSAMTLRVCYEPIVAERNTNTYRMLYFLK
jgi:hypothetical protein